MKIHKPIKRGETYRITVTFNKKRYSCTRYTEKECEQFAVAYCDSDNIEISVAGGV